MSDRLEIAACTCASPAATTMSVTSPTWHQPVMVGAVLRWLNPTPGAVIVDGTVGTGGHSLAILPRLLPDGRLLAVDRDPHALQLAQSRLAEFEPQVTLLHDNYRHLPELLARAGVPRVDGLVLDLGMSSLQVDVPERGFSFSQEGPLDMRMDPEQDVNAATLINHLPANDLTRILETLGEERFAKRISQRIVETRRTQPITTTTELVRVVVQAFPSRLRHARLHLATRTFQALRMAVNDELGSLSELLDHLHGVLKPGGRAVILTFQSLDDRVVKHAFTQGMREGRWTVLTNKPERATSEETAQNPRARSAKLRAIERTGD